MQHRVQFHINEQRQIVTSQFKWSVSCGSFEIAVHPASGAFRFVKFNVRNVVPA
jgi:hypothetical protein